MASTNTNTNSATLLSTDIYEIADFYDYIRQTNIPDVNDTADMVGIFGYMNEMFSQSLQNTLIVVSETTNETIPTRAKFTKNVLTHALNYGITDINAKPAVMTLMLYLPLSYFESNFVELNKDTGKAKFILSKNIPIFVGDFEFHLDYDIIIDRIRNPSGNYVYAAMYDLLETGTTTIKQQNPISDITNPYITTLVQATVNNTEYIAFSVRVHQVEYIKITKNILTSNSIENKVVTFDFDDQLASFDIDVIENGVKTHLTPIFNGLLDYTIDDGKWCYYEYVSENTIRIIFSRDSYIPGINAEVDINIYLSSGSSANFTYNQMFRIALKDEEYNNYNGMYALVYPLLNGVSNGGKDKKSVSDLRKIIPREASSRGSIINTTDLNNFFNSINDSECKIFFKKKRDNPFERMYYAYILLRKDANVYPTNTINLKLMQSDFIGHSANNNLSINPGTIFYYYNHGSDEANDYATLQQPKLYEPEEDSGIDYPITYNADNEYVRVYKYSSPFLITVDDDLITSYFLTVMNENKTFRFSSINKASNLQFVATNMQWVRNFYYYDEDNNKKTYDNKYKLTVDIAQNNNSDYSLITHHTDANNDMIFDDIKIRVFIVLYADETETNPYRYAEAKLKEYDPSRFAMTFEFVFETDDLFDLNNRINIKGVYNAKPEELQNIQNVPESHGYMNKNTYAKLFILADFTKEGEQLINGYNIFSESDKEDDIGNRAEINKIIPRKEDVIDQFLKNNLYITKNGSQVNVVNIIKNNPTYINIVMEYNNDDRQSTAAILKYLRENRDSEFVNNTLLNDEDVQAVMDNYHYEDLSRYTLCNVLSVENGIDFYHDYSNMMRSNVSVQHLMKMDENGNPIYTEIEHTDAYGNPYTELAPVYQMTEDGRYIYQYTLSRLPVLKAGYLSNEELIQDFIYDIEERRKYIEECLDVLEDTFDIDLKFVNTFGPSKTFYYNIPSSQNYKVRVSIKKLNVYSTTEDENRDDFIVGTLQYDQIVTITRVRGQWGYILSPFEGWIKLADTTKNKNFIDNVAVDLKFALEAQSTADKLIADDIVQDIKTYIEDINNINELHIPNIITLITNNYREQLVYFEFLDVNGYGPSCQHLYLYERDPDVADIAPEFINVATTEDYTFQPKIDVTVY